MKQQIVLVISGTLREFYTGVEKKIMEASSPSIEVEYTRFRNECRIGETRYIYMDDPDRLRGFRGVKVEFWGTWYHRDREELMRFHDEAALARHPRG